MNADLVTRLMDVIDQLNERLMTLERAAERTRGAEYPVSGIPGLHASTHKHGGADEVATATPAANAIPKADAAGDLDAWVSDASTTVKGKVELATSAETAAGLAVQASDTRLSDARTPTAHNLLNSTYHGDALTGSATRGDIIYGNATPKWARLAKGTSGHVLMAGASDVGWAALPDASTTVKGIAELAADGEAAAGLVAQSDDGRLTDGWWARSETWTRTSNTTFRVSGDLTAIFTPGTKIKVTQTSTKYFYVVSSSYSSPNTTVTITGGSDYSLTANPSARWISYQANPQGFPQWFTWTPSQTGWTGVPTGIYRFAVHGRTVHWVVNISSGTSNATGARLGLPITAAALDTGTLATGANGYAVDNGTVLTAASRWAISNGGTTVDFYKDMSAQTWTNSGTKRVYAQGFYEI
jgi:hypothetical protein